ncbi:MAG TPA: hypothetical protein VG099_19345 [Gemmataceae bacterium]|nr:hypothetical protein [Gemmataceae bacterium]
MKSRWAWSLLAACLIGSVIVVLHALVQLGQESNRRKVLRAESSAAHLRSQELERGDMTKRLIALLEKQQPYSRVDAFDLNLWKTTLQAPKEPDAPGDDAFDLDLWKTYLLDLKEADGIPDQELEMLRRNIRLMSLPDPARIEYELER